MLNFGMVFPTDFVGITQAFSEEHEGDDLGWNDKYGGKNQPVHSITDGIVMAVEVQKHGGNVIYIKHYNGFCSVYGHVQDVMVKVGEKVGFYQHICNMGNTGINKKTGKRVPYHLHLGLYKGDKVIYKGSCYVDPIKYLNLTKSQKLAKSTKTKYKILHTKTAKDIPNEPLLVRTKSNTSGKVVGEIYNGDEVTSYGTTSNGWNIVDNVRKYYCYGKYLK